MKISEAIETLAEAMREVGDAEVCVSVDDGDDALIASVSTGINVDVPGRGTVNIVVLRGRSPDAA